MVVEFFCEKDARSALKAASSGEFKVKGRPVAVDQATPKSDHVVARLGPPEASEDGASASERRGVRGSAEASDAAEEDDDDEESDEAEARKTRSRTTSPRAGRSS